MTNILNISLYVGFLSQNFGNRSAQIIGYLFRRINTMRSTKKFFAVGVELFSVESIELLGSKDHFSRVESSGRR